METTQDKKEDKKRIPMLFASSPGLRMLSAYPTNTTMRFNITKEAIITAIEQNNIPDLRKYSQYFYHVSGEYRRLVKYFASLLTFDYLIVPNGEEKALTSPGFLKDYLLIQDYAAKSYIKELGSSIAHSVIKDGAFYGYERKDGETFILQQLPNEFCRTTYKIGNLYSAEFDFSFFDLFRNEKDLKAALEAFPDEFAKLYRMYIKDKTNNRWLPLDPTMTRVHMLVDEVPVLSPVIVDLMELEEYKALDKEKTKSQIDEIIVQKIPVDDDGEIAMEADEIFDLHENAKRMVSGSTKRILTTPAEIKALEFKNTGNSYAMDEIEKGLKSVYSSAGTPMILFSTTGTSGSIGLAGSIKIDEAYMFELLDQFKMWYDVRFKTVVKQNKKYSFSIMFPPISIFNSEEKAKLYMEFAANGYPTKMLAAAALGLSQRDMTSLLSIENTVLQLTEKMIPTSNSHTQASGGEEDEGGRPESEEPLTESGEKTKDTKANENRAEEVK